MEAIRELLKQYSSADEEERRLAVSALAGFPFAQIKDVLLTALGDESWRVRKEAVDLIISASPGEELARELISLLTVQGNAGLRNSVVEVLQSVGEVALPHLVEHLAHEDAGVRKFIVDIMGGIGSAASLPELSAALNDSDSNVAAAAAESLGIIGDSGALPSLLESLGRDDLLIRYAILEALVKIGRPIPLAVITPLAGDPLLKKAVFDCLGVIGDLGSVQILIGGLVDRSRNVRESALMALDMIRQRSSESDFKQFAADGLSAFAGTDAVEYLMAMRESSDLKVKSAATVFLGLIGDLRAIGVLVNGLRDENIMQVSVAALKSVGAPVGAFLLERYAVADEEERCIIVHLAGELNLTESHKIASDALKDRSPLVRALAAEAIGKTELVELIPLLARLLNDDNAEVRRRATAALVRLANVARESVASSAVQLTEADNPDCRLQAVRLFGALRDVSGLIFLSKDEDYLVRRDAISTLGEIRSPDSAGRLVMALADEEADVRLAAATSLGWSGFPDESGSLLLALDDSSQRVQAAAIKSLGRRHELTAFDAVARFLSEPSGMLKIAAIQALALIDQDRVKPFCHEMTRDEDEEVVKVAMRLLEMLAERC